MIEPLELENSKAAFSQGKSKEDVYRELLGKGATVNEIEKVFSSVEKEAESENTQKKTVRIVLSIAALLVGAGVFSFIAANWEVMDDAIKVGVILVSMVLSYSAGWFFKENQQLEKTGGAFMLLGSLIFGAGIFLVAQIFNIRSNWPDGFILWMVGTICMAFAAELFELYYLAIITGVVAAISYPLGIFEFLSSYSGFLMTSSFLLLVAALITFATGFFLRKNIPSELKEYY